MNFSSSTVACVFSEYEQRVTQERSKAAALGGAFHQHRDEFLLSVGPEVGWFLHSLIIGRRPSRVLELGTSYGYSTLFLADAVKQIGGRLTTMDVAAYKQASARSMLERAGISDVVEFRLGDAVAMIQEDPGQFDFVLLDIWKDLYVPCLDAIYPKLSDEGMIAADNMIDPVTARPEARKYRDAVRALPNMQSTLFPIGQGIELSVKWLPANSKL